MIPTDSVVVGVSSCKMIALNAYRIGIELKVCNYSAEQVESGKRMGVRYRL
jgi:hypothetical protein